jgi:hypothetical protein
MDLTTPFKNKKKKYLLVEPSRWGADSVKGMMELTLNDTTINFNGDNYTIVDIRPMFHEKLRNQGELFLLYIMKNDSFNANSSIESWLESEGKQYVRNTKIDEILDGQDS